ncbi:peptidase M48 family protein [Sphingomonas aestuarii]
MTIASAPLAATRSAVVEADATLERVRALDMRLASIGYRIATTNAHLCADLEPATGVQLHSVDQYPGVDRARLQASFGFATRVAVGGVVANSPAAVAGIVQNDSLARIGDQAIPAFLDAEDRPRDPTALINRLYDDLAVSDARAPMTFDIVRGDERRAISVTPVPACRSRFEVDFARGLDAEADGRLVKLHAGFFDRYPDELVAVVVAHELSHNILRHRARLNEQGVSRGILAGFGRNVRYFRQTEIEADILAVHLLANAGYDPLLAGRFWRDYGPSASAGFLASRTHPGWRDRAARSDAEAARIATGQGAVIAQAFVQRRNQRLDGDWQRLLKPDGRS